LIVAIIISYIKNQLVPFETILATAYCEDRPYVDAPSIVCELVVVKVTAFAVESVFLTEIFLPIQVVASGSWKLKAALVALQSAIVSSKT